VANSNTPFGLAVVRTGNANTYSAQTTLYSIPSTDGSAFYLGDPVMAAASGDANGVPNVKMATAGTVTVRGVLVGWSVGYPGASIQGTPLQLENSSIPATKAAAYYPMICDDPNTVFMIQDDGITTGNLVAASCNLNFSLTLAAGANAQAASGTVILSSSFATTNTLAWKALGLAQFPGNAYGAYAKWLTRPNLHELNCAAIVGI
jgi:hypothetical protein